jgi:signal transduction histidine kinase
MQMNQHDLARMNRVMRHRLRNVASGIKGAVTYLGETLDDRLSKDEKDYFPLIVKECDALSELTGRLNLLFDDVPAGGSLLVGDLVAHVAKGLGERFPAGRLEAEVPAEAAGQRVAGGQALAVALLEVVVNAVEASPEGEASMSVSVENGAVRFSVSNQGLDESVEDLEGLFEAFHTSRARHLGIGLGIARKVVEGMGGGISMTREGCCCTVDLEVPLEEGAK